MSTLIDLKNSSGATLDEIGGKAYNLFELEKNGIPVPEFFVVPNTFFKQFIDANKLQKYIEKIEDAKVSSDKISKAFLKGSFPKELSQLLKDYLKNNNFEGQYFAVRSSGADEDSKEHSFAGMYSSFLYQKELTEIEESIIACWTSSFSERCLDYRIKNQIINREPRMGVVIQRMVNSDISGVMFSRNPMNSTDRQNIVIESVFGQCEGLVSGAVEADSYLINRSTQEIKSNIAEKESQFVKDSMKAGLQQISLDNELKKTSSLDNDQVKKLAEFALQLENKFSKPLDIEWCLERDKLYFVQMRPITTLPNLGFYQNEVNGGKAILWDNSNIVESFAGVTTPLTFSLTKEAYAIVYRQTCRLLDVPEKIIHEFDDSFENMLGFIRGRVYYNLINWYKLLFLIPGSASNKGFMETMMGVKDDLNEETQKLFNFMDEIPKYSAGKKTVVMSKLIFKFMRIKTHVRIFTNNFNKIYEEYLHTDFKKKSIPELKQYFVRWNNEVTYSWNAPIINDFLVMFFFGVLKKLTENWIKDKSDTLNLQNDLLCGQGQIDSTLPTITLMSLAQKYDRKTIFRNLFLDNETSDILLKIENSPYEDVRKDLDQYLLDYGFRCNNEQKLEEEDLTTKPDFVIDAIKNYIRLKNYSIEEMQEREHKIKLKAEAVVKKNIKGFKRRFYFWILKHTREAVRNRENMRFLRSKSFGITRRIFQNLDQKFLSLGLINNKNDLFYLNYREVFDYIDGKSESLKLSDMAKIRRSEFDQYRSEEDPPDRFISYGTVGASLREEQIVRSGDLLKDKIKVSDDPNLIYGISCCPGVIKTKVRVANSIEDAKDLNGEILVTKRTDPGWVPIFPSCGGLIVERGSLLSHSAVIARELGIPTIVGVSAGVMNKLKDGDQVELNATQGEIRIIHE